MSDHIVKAFDEELQTLKNMLARMGGLAEEELARAIDAISRRDGALADQVIASDAQVDALEREVEERAILVIARRQPMASDLREIMVAIRVSSDLERIGDFAKNIAKRVPLMSGKIPSSALEQLGRMGEIVVEMIRTAMDAYAKRDVDLARAVTIRDDVVDQLNKDLFVDFVAYVVKNPENATEVAHLLFTAKNLERIGDHTTNVAQMIYFTETGENLPDA